jgi:hypothetical protein
MQAEACIASVVSSKIPARRRLIRGVKNCLTAKLLARRSRSRGAWYLVAFVGMWSEHGDGLQPATTLMKSNDAKKETKKAPQKTAKEKKLAKQEKKAKR